MLRKTVATLAMTLLGVTSAVAQNIPSTGEDVSKAAVAGENPRHMPSPFDRYMKRRSLGYGRLTTNDVFGDGQDRWRTGSITVSRAFGYEWTGAAPLKFGELIELRMQGQIIAPDNLRKINRKDRPWAGALSLGLHSHSTFKGLEMALGADLVMIGPQTQLDSLQKSLHDFLNKPQPSEGVLALQIPNEFRPTVVAELGKTYSFAGNATLRPFAEFRAGDETLARVGADLNFGTIGGGELFSRESITGQRYRVIYASQPGTSFTIGGDIAYVDDSVYLPESRGYEIETKRERLRAGFHWQGQRASAFYGLTYLGREFVGQSEGQVTGSIRVKMRF